MSSLLDKLDVIECFQRAGRKLTVGEILEKQQFIYDSFGFRSPLSL